MVTTILPDTTQPIPAPRRPAPSWAVEVTTDIGLTTYRRPAQTAVTAFPDELDGDPYPVTVVLDEHHADGLVEGPIVNLYIPLAGVAAAFTVEEARQLRAALGELIDAHDGVVR